MKHCDSPGPRGARCRRGAGHERFHQGPDRELRFVMAWNHRFGWLYVGWIEGAYRRPAAVRA